MDYLPQLLGVEDTLSLVFEGKDFDTISINEDRAREEALQRRIDKIMNNPKLSPDQKEEQVKAAREQHDEYEKLAQTQGLRTPRDEDQRRRLVRSRYEVIDDLKEINHYRDQAAHFGLDGFAKKIMMTAISPKRHDEIDKYSDPEEIKREIKTLKAAHPGIGADQLKELEAQLETKGRFSLDEISTLKFAFQKELVPKLAQAQRNFDKLKNSDSTFRDIVDGTDFRNKIKLHYRDETAGGEEKTEVLEPSQSVVERLRKFGECVARTDNATKTKVTREFQQVYGTILKKLKESDEDYLGGDNNAAQRVYTAALYTIHKVAPLLNLQVQREIEKAKEKESKEAAKIKEKGLKDIEKALDETPAKEVDIDPTTLDTDVLRDKVNRLRKEITAGFPRAKDPVAAFRKYGPIYTKLHAELEKREAENRGSPDSKDQLWEVAKLTRKVNGKPVDVVPFANTSRINTGDQVFNKNDGSMGIVTQIDTASGEFSVKKSDGTVGRFSNAANPWKTIKALKDQLKTLSVADKNSGEGGEDKQPKEATAPEQSSDDEMLDSLSEKLSQITGDGLTEEEEKLAAEYVKKHGMDSLNPFIPEFIKNGAVGHNTWGEDQAMARAILKKVMLEHGYTLGEWVKDTENNMWVAKLIPIEKPTT